LEKALKIREEAFGEVHVDVASVYHLLGCLHSHQGFDPVAL